MEHLDKRRLVLLHPIGQDTDCWVQLGLPSAHAHLLLGHGGRPRCDDLGVFSDDVAAAIPDGSDIVGVAFGGLVALHLMLRHPARVRSAVIAAGCAGVPPEVALARADAAAEQGMEAVVDETLARWFTADAATESPVELAYARDCLLAIDPTSYADAWRAIAGHDVRHRLREIDAKITVVSGSGDVSSPPAAGRVVHESIPGSRFELLDAPHMMHLQRPQAFRATVVRHLEWAAESAPGGHA